MKNFLLLIALLISTTVCSAQNEAPEASECPTAFISTLSTYRQSISKSFVSLKGYTLDMFNSFWVSLPSNNRVGFSSFAYKQNALPFSSNHLNFEMTAYYGKKKDFYRIKALNLYTQWDIGIGKSKYDYKWNTDTRVMYDSHLNSYFHSDISLGLEFSIRKKMFLVAESQYFLRLANSRQQVYNLDSGLLEGPTHRMLQNTQGWLPLRALAFGWKI